MGTKPLTIQEYAARKVAGTLEPQDDRPMEPYSGPVGRPEPSEREFWARVDAMHEKPDVVRWRDMRASMGLDPDGVVEANAEPEAPYSGSDPGWRGGVLKREGRD
jgi:hypothetical protein